MKHLILFLPLMASLEASQTRAPDAIYRDLRTEFPNREVILRWANLDTDPESAAIIIDDRQEEGSHFATIYDRYLGKWAKAGEFRCHRGCPLNSFVGVYQLTTNDEIRLSPVRRLRYGLRKRQSLGTHLHSQDMELAIAYLRERAISSIRILRSDNG